MKPLTEAERCDIALAASQALACGSIRHPDCKEPRSYGDYMCPPHRAEFDAQFKHQERVVGEDGEF